MKKYVIGFIFGTMVAAASAAYASDAVQAVLFPAKYQVNGEMKTLPEGYTTLNVDGHAYVPIRFVAESLGAVVVYDEATGTIQVDNGFNVTNMESSIRAGYLQVSNADRRTVEGKLFVGQEHWDRMANARNRIEPGSEVDVGGNILFYDDQGHYMGKAPITAKFVAQGDQIKTFKAVADRDVAGFAFASLQVGPVPWPLPVPPDVPVQDPTGQLAVGTFRMEKQGAFTKVKGWISLKKPGYYRYDATLTFYDAAGQPLGTADLKGTGTGSTAEAFTAEGFETAGKGDFTGYKSATVTVNAFEPIEPSEL